MPFLSVYFLKSSNTIWTTALRDSERKAYRTSQSFLFELLFDLFLLINFSQLVSDWLHQRGFFLIFSFFFFFPALRFENFHRLVTHQRPTDYSIYIRLRSSFYSTGSVENDLICTMFCVMVSRGDIKLHIDVHICCPNLLFSWSFVLGHFIFFPSYNLIVGVCHYLQTSWFALGTSKKSHWQIYCICWRF